MYREEKVMILPCHKSYWYASQSHVGLFFDVGAEESSDCYRLLPTDHNRKIMAAFGRNLDARGWAIFKCYAQVVKSETLSNIEALSLLRKDDF